jgi:hypothetical protein
MELNRASERINHLETAFTAAATRRDYLAESMSTGASGSLPKASGCTSDFSQLRNLKDRIGRLSETYMAHLDSFQRATQSLKNGILGVQEQLVISSGQQESLNLLCLEVETAQKLRHDCEREYSTLLRKFEYTHDKSKKKLPAVFLDVFSSSGPYNEAIEIIQNAINAEDEILSSTLKQIEGAKREYKGVMLRLEEVSDELHRERQRRGNVVVQESS